MKLTGPAVASPRAAGKYVVGMPMWMWTDPSPTTSGPISASATAGGVTVTATAKVSTARWAMAPRSPATVPAPRTPLRRACRCRRTAATATKRPASDKPDGRYPGRRDVVDRRERPALGASGDFAETHETAWTAWVGEVQVLSTN
ncbi:ATP/GTP-binding protein [Streptomyces sp. NPDC006261]|uniref:ATP/GTP-binding protein n=1 Tax=Streptomyces sp. NPDC006261 TaxID=3156739 RepID=UPI0033A13865